MARRPSAIRLLIVAHLAACGGPTPAPAAPPAQPAPAARPESPPPRWGPSSAPHVRCPAQTTRWVESADGRRYAASSREPLAAGQARRPTSAVSGRPVPICIVRSDSTQCWVRVVAAWCETADGVKHGPFAGAERGVRVAGTYDHGVRDGTWTYYYATGAVKRRVRYVDGAMLESESYELVDGVSP